jgi:hypothetical protein
VSDTPNGGDALQVLLDHSTTQMVKVNRRASPVDNWRL